MAFIRKRISPTGRRTPSYQVIETYREGGKVKQRVLANLGRFSTVEEALEDTRWYLEQVESALSRGRLLLAMNGPSELAVRMSALGRKADLRSQRPLFRRLRPLQP